MPSSERDELTYSVEYETTLSVVSTASSLDDFPKADDDGSKFMRSYGSTGTTGGCSRTILTPAGRQDPPKDPEQCLLLPLPVLMPSPRSGLTRADIVGLEDDPFWCRVRMVFFSSFWLLIAAMLAVVAWIVVTDKNHCSPPAVPLPTVTTAGPHVLHAIMSSKY